MAIYYKIVFGLLVTEIAVFLALMIPLPNHLKQKSLLFIRDNVVSKAQYTLKIIAVFVFILLIDSVNHLLTAVEKTDTPESQANVRLANAINVKKFYAQRNTYLTGATLFLSFILNYTFELIIELLSTKENLKNLEKKPSNESNYWKT
ncbi:Endoplasmic reticulum transmembrane protein 3 [Entomophthora muscae]|uniref:Endoplasmic reticulum transmembrane protein 3 n=1 Tax=Entomophthora muscae TaxID=34485 RepID=A0ACC2UKA0_9FUNG|nr:Endoplasmic reticulum transmembrane protein 3 [Entomophthora muscae]